MRIAFRAIILTAVLASPAWAQFAPGYLPPGGRITSVPATSALSPAYTVPYNGVRSAYSTGGYYPNYGGVYIEDPVSGYYNGIANLTTAYGQYIQDAQRARLLQQDVERSKLATRRALIEQQMWEQSLIPNAEDVRKYKMEQELRRAINDPPLGDIVSGEALNVLLRTVQQAQAKGGYGPSVPLDEEIVRHINLSATPGANIALFKDGGKLRIPPVLTDPPFDKQSARVQDLVFKAVKETQAEELSPATRRELRDAITVLDKAVEDKGPELSIPDSIGARRFVDDLKSSAKALEHPSAGDSLNKKTAPQARTVGDLVSFMTRGGLRFVPALQGEEGPYRAIHQGLVSYSLGAMQSMRR